MNELKVTDEVTREDAEGVEFARRRFTRTRRQTRWAEDALSAREAEQLKHTTRRGLAGRERRKARNLKLRKKQESEEN